MRKISGVLFHPKIRDLLIIVIILVMSPSIGTVFNFFQTERLHFSPKTMGQINFISSASYLIGILALNTVFRGVNFKKFYVITTFMLTMCGLSSLVLIERWNVGMGISDSIFCLSNQALANFLAELNWLPLLGLGIIFSD